MVLESSIITSLMNKIHCPYHPMVALIDDYQTGDMICSACGQVVQPSWPFSTRRTNGGNTHSPESPRNGQSRDSVADYGDSRLHGFPNIAYHDQYESGCRDFGCGRNYDPVIVRAASTLRR
uniref:TFIIB-type domain-containing protein n=1 Tax=Anopheles epiroticus TaxID=199890 RepID=A0A182PB40_9DIPT